jgi:YgiT-type zinc finger domain-containing protein
MERGLPQEETKMNCVICKHGETVPGVISVTLERGPITVVFKGVPADVCDNCGEQYVNDATARPLLDAFEDAVHKGVVVDVRQYTAA